MAGIRESCSVCGSDFDVQFRYQMEERDGGFSFYCSQKCLEKSQLGGEGQGDKLATCDACAKRFQPELASQVMYLGGRRTYACSMPCRTQLQREASGVRLGEIAAEVTPQAVAPSPPPQAVPRAVATRASGPASAGAPAKRASSTTSPAVAVPVVPQVANKRTAPAAQASQAAPEAPKEQAADASVPRYLAVFNHKGGTGKTTTAVSVAAGLASRGKKVLLVDTDAQGNVSVSLGANVERSLYHVLVMGLRVADATRVVRPNLDLLGSNETLAAAELYLAGRQNRDRVLCERLSAAATGYDYVVLDCSPSLSLMNQNALVFADSVLVPVACDYLSLVGVRQVIKTVKNVNALLHHPVQIWGVLPTFFDARAKICREAVTTLKQHFGDRCLPPVRAAIKVKEAPAQGQTIFEYAAGTPAAEDYGVVVDRIIQSREGAAKGGKDTKDTKDAKPASRAAATA
ncbi:ParA family protein [Polyangium sp. 6x1]|uniref:ParA family protein n=1 Tax=Polyangium sp. 6x1 TaxID=3042689 RepID=UPI00248286B1|nr:ParA family protein [Polyangium sp. 6x1]MDI1449248.1 ParA family protein [Polyangium sp. 6x1]